MDFVTSLAKTSKGSDTIWVVMDRPNKSAYFIQKKISYPLQKLAEVYIEKFVSLYGIPSSNVSDRDPSIGITPFEALYGRRCWTPMCWYDYGENVVFGPKIVQYTTKKIKMIQEKMRASQSQQKSYHDKRRKMLKFREGEYVFLRVTPVTGVGRALKSQKLTPHLIGPYQILKKVGEMDYIVTLPPYISDLCNVFHVSQLWKYVPICIM
ncbi:uncharacterized protein LOC127137613 [Lathyrus oleraceus]|uniref:uncharacterized protein LOC127137613 n=1 Tax=Pisum sativum TaxID=3888 RepID=UPI0021D05125|nr:uncharacterized protein LOC127137613 [Pisum sativum]